MAWWDTTPWHAREQWTLEPLVGLGPLRFGMRPDEVTAALGEDAPSVTHHAGTGGGSAQYANWGVTAVYGKQAQLVAVKVDAMGGPRVKLRGIDLIARAPSEVRSDIDRLARQDGACARVNWSGDPEVVAWGVSMGAELEFEVGPQQYVHRTDKMISSALFVGPDLADAPYASEPVVRWRDVSIEEPNPGAWPVKAESDRPLWVWRPLESVGPLRFGMDPDQVADALKDKPAARHGRYPFGSSWEGIGEWMLHDDRFDAAGVTAHYRCGFGVPPVLGAVTVHGRTGPQVEFDGMPLIGRKVSAIDKALIERADNGEMSLLVGCNLDLGPDGLNMYVRATRAGDSVLSEARFCQADWEDQG
ncbi:hypothetical protein ACFYVC_21085 [Streptomyces tendae]|uniref:hypothetical protein n=1 Tax=Streptomyces tendae TaxID=1932 RepID=UPI00367735A1